MSKEIFEGGTVETALAQASDKLGVEVSQLEHVMISEKRDFWGAGEDTVTIEAWVRPEQHEEFAEPETKSAAQPKNLAGEDDDAEAPKAIADSGEFQNSDRAEVSEATEEEPPPDSDEAVSSSATKSASITTLTSISLILLLTKRRFNPKLNLLLPYKTYKLAPFSHLPGHNIVRAQPWFCVGVSE